ncbi:MAG: head-tail connector protein, partial [Oscillospiraceae bacterium]|nr:head-tail connector protein [Oscillospiraceae bacterium]
CDYSDPRTKLLALVIITELYEKRSFSVEKAGEKAQYTIRSIIAQLQAEEYANET